MHWPSNVQERPGGHVTFSALAFKLKSKEIVTMKIVRIAVIFIIWFKPCL